MTGSCFILKRDRIWRRGKVRIMAENMASCLDQIITEKANKFEVPRVQCLAIFIIIIAQLCLMFFWAIQKSNYFIDEFYSFGYAHSFTFDKKDITYITQSEEWQYEKWIDNSILKEKLVVSEPDSLLSQSPLTALKMLFTRRNHQGILNILFSVFSPGKVEKYPGIVFNLLIFILTQIVLFRICKELTDNAFISLLALFMYGFSSMAIGTSIYVRFYALVILLLILLLRMHQIMWRSSELWKCELLAVLSMAVIYLAMKNSELVFIFAGALIAAYFAGLMIKGEPKKGWVYFITVVPVGLLYACKKTDYVDMILHPANYLQGVGPKGWMTQNLLNFNAEQMKGMLKTCLNLLSFQLFGTRYVLCGFFFVIIILLEIRYLGKKSHNKPNITDKKGFVWIIFAVGIIYVVFAFLTGLERPRYWSLIFPVFVILLWKAIDSLTKQLEMKNLILSICMLFTLTGVSIAQLKYSDKISYVYRNDRPMIQELKDSDVRDCIAIYMNHKYNDHSVYDCVNQLPDTARIYPVSLEHHHINTENFPDEVLIWMLIRQDIQPYTEDLVKAGYTIEKLGSTHCSDVYLAHRSE